MRKIAVVTVTALLVGIICLQILAALNIFPRQDRVEVCPVDAISMRNSKAVIDSGKCIGCRRCVAGVAVPSGEGTDTASQTSRSAIQPGSRKSLDAGASSGMTVKTEERNPPATINPPTTSKAAKNASTPKKESTAQPETSGAKHQVDPAKCIGCGLCTIYCPTQAITMQGDKAVIDPDKCINCGLCRSGNNAEFKGCPVKAISAP